MPQPQMYVALVDGAGNLLAVNPGLLQPEGRLTPTTATPVPVAAATAVGTVFYTPHIGNYVPLWNATTVAWIPTVFSELSNVLANSAVGNAGPAAAVASKNYDLFVWNNGGTPTLTRGGAWNSDTVRSATTENDLQRIQGVLCNLNAITNGPAAGAGLYVGTIRTDAGGATCTFDLGTAASGGGLSNFGLYNQYNQISQIAVVSDNGTSDTYTSNVIRARRGSATYRVNLVAGQTGAQCEAINREAVSLVASATAFFTTFACLDTTTVGNNFRGQFNSNAAAVNSGNCNALAVLTPGLGFHFISGNEAGDNVNANTINNASINSTLSVRWSW